MLPLGNSDPTSNLNTYTTYRLDHNTSIYKDFQLTAFSGELSGVVPARPLSIEYSPNLV
jgi:hypothetical protein